MARVAPVVALILNKKRDVEDHIEIGLYIQILSSHKMPHLGNLYSVFSVVILWNNLCCDAISPHRAVSLRNQAWSFPVGKLLFHFYKIKTEERERANNLSEKAFGKVGTETGLQTYRIRESFRLRKTIKIIECVSLPSPHITHSPLCGDPVWAICSKVMNIYLLLKAEAFKCICTVT